MSKESEYEDEMLDKADNYLRKSNALALLLETSQSSRTYMMMGEKYYEYVFDKISSDIAKHIKVFGEAVTMKVDATYHIVVTIGINE